jgi:K+-transporting ATPase ATPase A chain
MLVMVFLTVFIAGLMVGRTPEYLGKKIEAREMKLAMLYVLIFPLLVLGLSAWASVAPHAVSSLSNTGPHGLSRSCTPRRARPGTTARPSPASPATRGSRT